MATIGRRLAAIALITCSSRIAAQPQCASTNTGLNTIPDRLLGTGAVTLAQYNRWTNATLNIWPNGVDVIMANTGLVERFCVDGADLVSNFVSPTLNSTVIALVGLAPVTDAQLMCMVLRRNETPAGISMEVSFNNNVSDVADLTFCY